MFRVSDVLEGNVITAFERKLTIFSIEGMITFLFSFSWSKVSELDAFANILENQYLLKHLSFKQPLCSLMMIWVQNIFEF